MFSIRCQQVIRLLYNIQTTSLSQPGSPSSANNNKPISTSAILQNKYYESLGISASSTQNEIKAAYYKLSMVYHPDKNQGSESAAKKFREITQAYEVLSNYRLRRLYDKGIIHTAGPSYAQANNVQRDMEDVEEDDPQTKFYKSRFTKSKVANPKGETPIYDFDEWAKAHYGKSFDRKKTAKDNYDRKAAEKREHAIGFQKELVIYGIVFSTILFYIVSNMEKSYDRPKNRGKES